MKKKVITRIKGGLGNQLFCYAAARHLALITNAELVIDHISGFSRDKTYRRQYALNRFNIHGRNATAWERLEPFERYRRGFSKLLSSKLPYEQRQYIEEDKLGYDETILKLRLNNEITYLDGLWQSELYFKEIESIIREDCRIKIPCDAVNQEMAKRIVSCNSIALHVRWFDTSGTSSQNVGIDYYRKAIDLIRRKVNAPHFFVFSDNPNAAMKKLDLDKSEFTIVQHNKGEESAFADMWLMQQCRHFIVANSTFSWWGAWLGESASQSLVLAPSMDRYASSSWDYSSLVPSRWELI